MDSLKIPTDPISESFRQNRGDRESKVRREIERKSKGRQTGLANRLKTPTAHLGTRSGERGLGSRMKLRAGLGLREKYAYKSFPILSSAPFPPLHSPLEMFLRPSPWSLGQSVCASCERILAAGRNTVHKHQSGAMDQGKAI